MAMREATVEEAGTVAMEEEEGGTDQ
ncbi:hypothetical protein A2U01_0100094, partial [Trifolium medium]|nr:hypothetical protein [Trifolium medium]